MTGEALRARLAAAGMQLADADKARGEALEQARAALKASHGQVTIKDAAALLGITRKTAYRLLEK